MYAGTVHGYGRLTRGQRYGMGVNDARNCVMTEFKLTKQSEAILAVLRDEGQRSRLTDEEIAQIRAGLRLRESLGVLGYFVVKLAGVIAALGALWALWDRR